MQTSWSAKKWTWSSSFKPTRMSPQLSQQSTATLARRQLVGAINDPSALGALRAFQEAGRSECCAIMGHNASPEGRAELRQPNTRLLGSVAFFPERYGEDLIRVSLDILNRRPVPPAVFVEHKLITPRTVDHFYPNDSLTQGVPIAPPETACQVGRAAPPQPPAPQV